MENESSGGGEVTQISDVDKEDLTSEAELEEDDEYIDRSLNRITADESFDDVTLDKDRISPPVTEDIRRIVRPIRQSVQELYDIDLRHKATVADVIPKTESDKLTVEFEVTGTDDTFTRTYKKTSDKLQNLFLLAGSNVARPSHLVEREVPITAEYQSGHRSEDGYQYEVHYPPEKTGILRKLVYYSNRTAKNAKLVQQQENGSLTYKPTSRYYLLVTTKAIR